MPDHVFTWTANILIIWGALVGVASVVVHSRVRWWASVMGRHIMAYQAVIAAVLVLAVVRMFLGDQWWFSLLRLVVFVGVPIVMTHRLILQIRAHRAARADTPGRNPR